MLLKKLKSHIFTIFLAVVLIFSFTFTLSKISGQISGSSSENISYIGPAALNINNYVSSEKSNSTREEGQKESVLYDMLLFLASAVFFGNTARYAACALLVFLTGVFRKTLETRKMKEVKSRIIYYLKWCIEFLSPVEEIMQNRADEYDINPIRRYIRYKNPRLALLRQSAGFFNGVIK